MTDQKPAVVYAATYARVSAAEADLDAIEQLHKDQVIGSFDAAVIDKKDGKPHVAKRMDNGAAVASMSTVGSNPGQFQRVRPTETTVR